MAKWQAQHPPCSSSVLSNRLGLCPTGGMLAAAPPPAGTPGKAAAGRLVLAAALAARRAAAAASAAAASCKPGWQRPAVEFVCGANQAWPGRGLRHAGKVHTQRRCTHSVIHGGGGGGLATPASCTAAGLPSPFWPLLPCSYNASVAATAQCSHRHAPSCTLMHPVEPPCTLMHPYASHLAAPESRLLLRLLLRRCQRPQVLHNDLCLHVGVEGGAQGQGAWGRHGLRQAQA